MLKDKKIMYFFLAGMVLSYVLTNFANISFYDMFLRHKLKSSGAPTKAE